MYRERLGKPSESQFDRPEAVEHRYQARESPAESLRVCSSETGRQEPRPAGRPWKPDCQIALADEIQPSQKLPPRLFYIQKPKRATSRSDGFRSAARPIKLHRPIQ